MYSLRKQAYICKAARGYGVEELLPWSMKKSNVKEERKVLGSRVKGTGVGQRPKGHMHERHMVSKLEDRRRAMLKMPELVREWKLVSVALGLMPLLTGRRKGTARGGRNGQDDTTAQQSLCYHRNTRHDSVSVAGTLWISTIPLLKIKNPEIRIEFISSMPFTTQIIYLQCHSDDDTPPPRNLLPLPINWFPVLLSLPLFFPGQVGVDRRPTHKLPNKPISNHYMTI
jgi:hypothetical protein